MKRNITLTHFSKSTHVGPGSYDKKVAFPFYKDKGHKTIFDSIYADPEEMQKQYHKLTDLRSPNSTLVKATYFLAEENQKKYPKKHGFLIKSQRFNKGNIFRNPTGPGFYDDYIGSIDSNRKKTRKELDRVRKVHNKYMMNGLGRLKDRFGDFMEPSRSPGRRPGGWKGSFTGSKGSDSGAFVYKNHKVYKQFFKVEKARTEEESSEPLFGPYDSGAYDGASFMFNKAVRASRKMGVGVKEVSEGAGKGGSSLKDLRAYKASLRTWRHEDLGPGQGSSRRRLRRPSKKGPTDKKAENLQNRKNGENQKNEKSGKVDGTEGLVSGTGASNDIKEMSIKVKKGDLVLDGDGEPTGAAELNFDVNVPIHPIEEDLEDGEELPGKSQPGNGPEGPRNDESVPTVKI